MKKLYFLLSCLLLSATACQKEIDLKLPDERPKIVLNGVLRADSVLRIHLTESRFILDNRPIRDIETASLHLFEDGLPAASWNYLGGGVYEAQGLLPQAGRHYKLKVEAPGLDPAESEAVVPHPLAGVEILSIDTLYQDMRQTIQLRLRLQDEAGGPDYYLINRINYRSYVDHEGEEISRYFFAPLASASPAVISTCEVDYGYDLSGCKILLNDRTFEGKSRELLLSFYMNNWGEFKESRDHLVISRISEDYYKYLLFLYHNSRTSDNPFAEPVSVHMNINGGYGILGTSSSSWLRIDE